MVVDVVAAELDSLHERIGGRFTRSEPRGRAREYVTGLVAGLERKNGWTLAERAGEVSPVIAASWSWSRPRRNGYRAAG